MKDTPKRFMLKPPDWAMAALAAEIVKHPKTNWREVATNIFVEGCKALGYPEPEEPRQ